jgi:predicted choloylglycine hydrolase
VIRFLFSSALLIWTAMLALFHSGVMYKPQIRDTGKATAEWIDKEQAGIHQLILSGPPYERGLKAGQLTKHLLLKQEDELNRQLDPLLPKKWMRQAAVLTLIAWFQGIDKYFKPEYVEEMYGVSKSAPDKYNYLADPFTRQIAYHGLHEVGQMMVDQGFEGMGCTVAAVKRGKNWILGRNFDFEGGRIFDTEKIMKWVFPEKGNAFVHVIWAGMVGAVTGVNEKGVYISINAAGSDDYRRVGVPSTLVILQVLQEANTTAEAVKILEEAPVFISDIYVVNDRSGDLRVVEKTPRRVANYALKGNGAVANHLVSNAFKFDKTNNWRKEELTTIARLERAQKLAEDVSPAVDLDDTAKAVLSILRDKGVDEKGRPLNLGNRRAIDALIATHSVVYDGVRGILYVGKGPALAGEFLGYDLKSSFAGKHPVRAGTLPHDPAVSDQDFFEYKENTSLIAQAHRLVKIHKCVEGLGLLESVRGPGREQSEYYHALGDAQACLNSSMEARVSWQKALQLTPAYAKQVKALQRNLGL